MADKIFTVKSSSFRDIEVSSSLRAVVGSTIDLTQASVVTGSFTGRGDSLTNVSASYIIPTANATASFALTASVALNALPTVSSSWASSSISSSYAETSSFAINIVQQITSSQVSSSFASSSISASYANTSSWAINAINGGTTLTTGSTYPITASWALESISSSFATIAATANAISFVPLTSTSASWVSASAKITTADTASYVLASSINGTVASSTQALYATQSINATQSLTANSASWVSASAFITTAQTASYILGSNVSGNVTSASYAETASFLTRNRTYEITSSWAVTSSYSITSSYVATTFSRGGTIYDPLGMAGTAATASNIIIWRAPFAATITNVWGYRVTGSGAIINARINGVGTIANGSHISLTSADTWISASSLITSSIAAGDKLEIMLVSSSAYPTQIAVQIDFTR